MPMYSHSRLSVYETCPRQFRFQYVDKVAVPEAESVEMFLGSWVHHRIQADTAFPLLEGPHCARCSYQPICPAWSHLFTQEVLPESA